MRRGSMVVVGVLLMVATAACGPTGTTATVISAGRAFSCGIVANGNVKCWGSNNWGQLGDGTTTDSPTPVSVVGVTGATALSLGDNHACAVVAAGAVKCWGRDDSGQLGNGTIMPSSTALDVTGVTGVTALAAGAFHTCAVVDGGAVKCWGANESFQLGRKGSGSATATTIVGLTGATAITGGYAATCVLVAAGAAKCWGADSDGQLGNAGTTNSSVPVDVVGVTGATAISAGDYHACVLVDGGAVKCWGRNSLGQLGNGTTSFSPTSTPMSVSGLTGATALAVGGFQSCALVANGAIQCWGDDYYGTLGNNVVGANYPTPVGVIGITGATAVTTEGSHACALASDGSIKCWGSDGYGQLGHGPISIDAVTYNLADVCPGPSGCNGGGGEADAIAAIAAGGPKADIYATQQACSDRIDLKNALGTSYEVLPAWEVTASDGGACGSATTALGNVLYVTVSGSTTWTTQTVSYTDTDLPAHRNFACAHTQIRWAAVLVCNTHLAEGSDPTIATSEANQLLSWLQSNRRGFETAIVLGDFNLAPSADGNGWDQAWRNAGYSDANSSHLATDGSAETDYMWTLQASGPAAGLTFGQHSDHQAVRAQLTPYVFESPLPIPVL